MSADTQTTHMANKQVPEPGTPADEAIVVKNFTKSYGSNRVVDELQFTVQRGEIFALLGPNGAGKTTTIETLDGYRQPDTGFSGRANLRYGHTGTTGNMGNCP